MESQLRSLLFQLMDTLNILKDLRDALRLALSQEEPSKRLLAKMESRTKEIKAVIGFLEKIKNDAERYFAGKVGNDIGSVFPHFLTALSLTEDQRISHGSIHAIAQVPLLNFPQYYRDIDKSQQENTMQQLDSWISFLGSLGPGVRIEGNHVKQIETIVLRFQQTADLIERALID